MTFISLATQVNITTPLKACVRPGNEVCPCVRMCAWICASARWFWIRAQHWDVKLPWQPNTPRHTTSPWHHDYFAATICTDNPPRLQINVCRSDCRSSVQKKEGPSGFSFSLLLGTFAIWRQQEVGEKKRMHADFLSSKKILFSIKTQIFYSLGIYWIKATFLFFSLIYSHLVQTCNHGVSSCQTTRTHTQKQDDVQEVITSLSSYMANCLLLYSS